MNETAILNAGSSRATRANLCIGTCTHSCRERGAGSDCETIRADLGAIGAPLGGLRGDEPGRVDVASRYPRLPNAAGMQRLMTNRGAYAEIEGVGRGGGSETSIKDGGIPIMRRLVRVR